MSSRKSIVLDNSTQAGNPAVAQVSLFRYARHYPKWPLLFSLTLTACTLLTFAVSGWFAMLLLPILAVVLLYGIWIREFFDRGDANPGIVVQLDPTLIAVSTDLRMGAGSYPAIKVIRAGPRRSMGQRLQPGMLLPAVAVYRRPHVPFPHWSDLDPRPLECATADKQTLDRVTASFTVEECRHLEAAIRELPDITPGLYMLSDSQWRRVHVPSIAALFFSIFAASLRPDDASRDLPLLKSRRKI